MTTWRLRERTEIGGAGEVRGCTNGRHSPFHGAVALHQPCRDTALLDLREEHRGLGPSEFRDSSVLGEAPQGPRG
ncbi:hypothetical protein [Streptomyces sp. R44]|uniref:Uncharacterized protein n=1 Tax=Streptomyces sp. R44 TaxID=3238633 RepID=A0AB39STZ1_9ACTN